MRHWTNKERESIKQQWLKGNSSGLIAMKLELSKAQVDGQIGLMKLFGKRIKT